jgi:signal transduction histidine kinase
VTERVPNGMTRTEAVSVALATVLMTATLAFTVVMTAAFGADFYTAVAGGHPWTPVDGYLSALILLALQASATVVVPLRARLGDWAPLIMMTVATVSVTWWTLAPDRIPPLNNTTDTWLPLAVSFAAWSAAYFGMARRNAILGVLLFAVLTVVSTKMWLGSFADFAYGVLLTTAPVLFGLFLGYRKRSVDAWRDRARRAEREQELLAEQARGEERVRLAGEMHDVVTHRLSLMVLQAGALGITASDAETVAAAEELRATGCQALAELRDLIGVLRSSADEQESTVDGGNSIDLAELVADSQGVGLRVSLAEQGDSSQIAPVVRRTAYRIVQEALTNVHKHSPGAVARVVVDYRPDGMHVVVRNGPSTAPHNSALRATGSGTGLDGLRRRVAVVRGTLTAAGTADGGFTVDASLPAYVPTSELVGRWT